MQDRQRDIDSLLKLFEKLESLVEEGALFEDACSRLGIGVKDAEHWINRLAIVPDGSEMLSSSHIPASVLPIFRQSSHSDLIEHSGSGVALRIGDELFVLTASHVVGAREDSRALLMPACEGIEQITGGISTSCAGQSDSKIEDPLDIAYIRLSPDWTSKIHPDIRPLSLTDLERT